MIVNGRTALDLGDISGLINKFHYKVEELEKELEEAQARIEELENELEDAKNG